MIKKIFITLLILLSINLFAQEEWEIIKPSNTGIPGEIVRFAKLDQSGNLWVAARYGFWGEGGIAKYDWNKWTTYSNVDYPLPSEIVNDAAFEINGTAWLATDGGLVKFDGNNWTIYNSSNTPLPADKIRNVSIDSEGNIWVLSKSVSSTAHGLAKFDGTNWTVYTTGNSGIPSFDLVTFAIDNQDNIWLSSWASGSVMFDGTNWTLHNGSNGYTDYRATAFSFDSQGRVWSSNTSDGIYFYDGSGWTQVSGLNGNFDYSVISVDNNDDVWIGTYDGKLAKRTVNGWVVVEYGNHLYSIEFDSDNNVWAGGLAHAKKFNINGSYILTYNTYNTGLTSYFVNNIEVDENNNYWFASDVGVAKKENEIWRGFNPYNYGSEPWPFTGSNGSNYATDVASDGNGNIWVSANGIAKWNNVVWTLYTQDNSGLHFNLIDCLEIDNNGTIYAGSEGYGASVFDGTNWEHLTFGPSYTANTIVDIKADNNGNVWFASDFGLHKYDGQNITTYDHTNSGLPSSSIRAIDVAPDGSLWIGTFEGLVKFDALGWTVYNESNSGLPANNVSSIAIRNDGTVFAGAYQISIFPYYGGFSKFDGTNWTTYTPSNSPLTHRQVEALELDNFGNLLISPISEGVVLFNDNGIVPVELTSFTAEVVNDNVQLDWKTATEINNKGFDIERSDDNIQFEKVGFVNGNGTTSDGKSYSFIDNNVIAGKLYYRLKQIDFNGDFEYSEIINITTETPENFSLAQNYPNPFNPSTTIKYSIPEKGNVKLTIYNSLGEAIKTLVNETKEKGSYAVKFEAVNLASGMYIYQLKVNDFIANKKFILMK